MEKLKERIEKILPRVQKPARYWGNELNSVHKDFSNLSTKVALAFPDVYEVAMSHLGLQILYHVINKREDAVAERVHAPWIDMEEQMRQNGVSLFSLESHFAVKDFDMVGFTLQYEMSYTNIINMLDLANIPIWQTERTLEDPFVIAGGPCVFNPEPLADFFDIFVLGESEAVILELIDTHKQWQQQKGSREDFLLLAANIPGIYVPSFYEVTYTKAGTIDKVVPLKEGVNPRPTKRIVEDLDVAEFPTAPVVPYLEVIHDRMVLEIFRGCLRGCRYCQAGFIYRPVREKSVETLLRQAQELVKQTGYEEISLASLSTSDYSAVQELIGELNLRLAQKGVSISLPSLRIDSFGLDLAKEVQKVRKSGLTLAPEAGTQRLRNVINKQVTEENLYNSIKDAAEAGWKRVKLYFMIGLPTETYEDLDGIVDMAAKVAKIGNMNVTVSTASFVPKPHTPFQWEPQTPMEELEKRQKYLLNKFKKVRRIRYNYHSADVSMLEAVFAKGDRRLAKVLAIAHQLGCKFDSWDEHFKFDQWLKAFDEAELDPAFYANRQRDYSETLPWDHLNVGVNKEYLQQEREQALAGETTIDCRSGSCTVCGVCPALKARVRTVKGELI